MLFPEICGYFRLPFFLLCVFATHAYATEEKHALIIGNSQYGADSLKNPVNDAQDMAEALARLGYKIHSGSAFLNTTGNQLRRAITSFADQLPSGATALVFYAGHGVSWQGDNYLLPTDTGLMNVDSIQDQSMSLQTIVNKLADANPEGSNIFLLDACRNNPLTDRLGGNIGLTRIYSLPHGTFIGYAAQEGRVASDGKGRNGRYTAALLEALENYSSLAITEFHREVRRLVYSESRREGENQLPMEEATVTARLCFGSCDIAFEVPEQSPPLQTTAGVAEAIEESSSNRKTLLFTVLGAVLVGLMLSQDNGSDSQDSVTLNLTPPAQ
jgi:uncharacterized caspase-like protein